MTIIVRPGTEMASAVADGERISAEERARRKAAVDYARASVRLEGFQLSEFAEDLNRRYINGEITRAEKTAAILAYYKS